MSLIELFQRKCLLCLVIGVVVVGCNQITLPTNKESKVIQIFLNPFCLTFQHSTQVVRTVRFEADLAHAGIKTEWISIPFSEDECDLLVAKYISCAQEFGEAASIIDSLVSSDLSLSTCSKNQLEELLNNTIVNTSLIQQCVITQGEALLRRNNKLALRLSVNAIPSYSIQNSPPSAFFSLEILEKKALSLLQMD